MRGHVLVLILHRNLFLYIGLFTHKHLLTSHIKCIMFNDKQKIEYNFK